MQINVYFYSYFKELTGCAQVTETVADGGTLEDLRQTLVLRFPKLGAMRSELVSVHVIPRPHAELEQLIPKGAAE